MKEMKKFATTFAVLLCLCAAVFAANTLGSDLSLAPKAAAATIVDSGECGDEGDNVTWTLDDEGTLTVSGAGKVSKYFRNLNPSMLRQIIKKVVITDGITEIGSGTFFECHGITEVTIPDSVVSIGERAFDQCVGITSLKIPESVTTIGKNAFRYVANVEYSGTASGSPWGARSVNGYIDENGLVYDSSSKKILLACPSSKQGEIVLPDFLSSIGDFAFAGCYKVTHVEMTEFLKTIGVGAFYYCCSLTDITIPKSVVSVGEEAFYFVPNVNYSGTQDSSSWGAKAVNGYVDDGLVYENSEKEALLGCSASKQGEVVLPESVTYVARDAFFACGNITKVLFPDSVEDVWDELFFLCDGLTEVRLSNSVTYIGESAFYGCSSLTSITIPEGITSIERYTFEDCSSLTSITIPSGVTSIGQSAFRGCSSLTSITIPDSVTSIGRNAFRRCSSLTSITIPEGVTNIDEETFFGCSSLTNITIPDSITSIGRYAFEDCSSLNKVYAANLDSWLKIKFSGWGSNPCNNGADLYFNGEIVKDVVIPGGVTSIGDSAFHGCIGLTDITIPDSVTSIGDSAFHGCIGLTDITIPDSVTSIGREAFSDCTDLTSITIPESVTIIESSAFSCGYKLTEVYILNPDCITEESSNGIFSYGAAICSHAGYGVEKYAKKNGFAFVPIHINENTATAKCTEEVTEAKCKYCDEMTLPVLIHDFTVESADEKYLCEAATCYRPASYYVSCKDCGLSSKDLPGEKTFTYGEAVDHKGKWVISSPATCTSTGYENRYCIYCDCNLGGRTIPALGHTPNGGETTVIAPSCTEKGYTVYTCSVCGAKYDDAYIDALGHDFTAEKIDDEYLKSAAMCTENAVYYTSCVRCGLSSKGTENEATFENGETLGHNWGGWKSNEDGTHTRACARDGSHTETADCSASSPIHTDATCTENAYDTYTCEVCGYVWRVVEENSALGHDEIHHNAKAATCTEKGNKAYVTCSRCDYTTFEETPALGHDFTAEKIDDEYLKSAATCTEKAVYYTSCIRCGLSSMGTENEATFENGEALGHTPAAAVNENVLEPTCVNNGICDSVVYCAVCEEELSREKKNIDALGHDFTVKDGYIKYAATCTERAVYYASCVRCGLSSMGTENEATFEIGEALGHIEEVIPAVAANCMHTGLTEGKQCTRCYSILVEQQEIAKTAHSWDNGTVTKAPQIGVAGEKTFTCTVCSATRTEEIAPLVPSAPDRIEVKSSDSAKELTDGIVGATHSVTVSELLASSNASYVVDKDGNRITETTMSLATGMKIILESGGERLEKVISVLGDVNGDGDISVSDARGALRAAVGLDTLEGAYLNAARVNGSNEVAVSDARSILRAAVALDTGKDWLANIK